MFTGCKSKVLPVRWTAPFRAAHKRPMTNAPTGTSSALKPLGACFLEFLFGLGEPWVVVAARISWQYIPPSIVQSLMLVAARLDLSSVSTAHSGMVTGSGSRGEHADCIKVVIPLHILAPASPMVVWLKMAPKYPGLGVQKQVVGRPI